MNPPFRPGRRSAWRRTVVLLVAIAALSAGCASAASVPAAADPLVPQLAGALLEDCKSPDPVRRARCETTIVVSFTASFTLGLTNDFSGLACIPREKLTYADVEAVVLPVLAKDPTNDAFAAITDSLATRWPCTSSQKSFRAALTPHPFAVRRRS